MLIYIRYLATCSADTTVKIWAVHGNYEFRLDKTLIGHQRWVWDCAFSADSAYLVTGIWSMFLTPQLLKILPLASSDHTARLWEMSSGETVRQYNGHHKGLEPFVLRYFHQSNSCFLKLLYVVHCMMVLAKFYIVISAHLVY